MVNLGSQAWMAFLDGKVPLDVLGRRESRVLMDNEASQDLEDQRGPKDH